MTTIAKKDIFSEWETDVFDDKPDPELTRVLAILEPILSHLDDDAKIGYHFGENNGHDEKHFEETATGKKWKTGIDYKDETLMERF